jgi:hypothetical protein
MNTIAIIGLGCVAHVSGNEVREQSEAGLLKDSTEFSRVDEASSVILLRADHAQRPCIPVIPKTREHVEYAVRKSVDSLDGDYDLILLSTGNAEYNILDFSGLATGSFNGLHHQRNFLAIVHLL